MSIYDYVGRHLVRVRSRSFLIFAYFTTDIFKRFSKRSFSKYALAVNVTIIERPFTDNNYVPFARYSPGDFNWSKQIARVKITSFVPSKRMRVQTRQIVGDPINYRYNGKSFVRIFVL